MTDSKINLTLEQATKSLSQINLLLGGVAGLVLLGKNLYDQIKSTGATTEEAKVAVAAFEAKIAEVSAKNTAWLAAHPGA